MSSGFVSERDLDEARRKRQEEWEKVRTADQPVEAPEVPYDSRSLYERLEEQKRKKDLEFEEARKLKNMIKGLDDDEVEFLDYVDQKKLDEQRRTERDEKMELLDFQKRVAELHEKTHEQRLHAAKVSMSATKHASAKGAQNKLKSGLIVKAKKRKVDEDKSAAGSESEREAGGESVGREHERSIDDKIDETPSEKPEQHVLKCIGILPGIGSYGSSDSDTDHSSCDDDDVRVLPRSKYDLIGRKIKRKHDSDTE